MLPSVIIPGAEKSGSTTVYDLVTRNPRVNGGVVKEPNFFSKDSRFHKGMDFYQKNYQLEGDFLFAVDASSSYLQIPLVPQRIYQKLGPQVKFIITLRNPIDRALSAYSYYQVRQSELGRRQAADLLPSNFHSLNHLNDFIDFETQNTRKLLEEKKIIGLNPTWSEYLVPFNYFETSRYSVHIKNFRQYFPPENFLFLEFQEIRDPLNQHGAIAKIEEFLQIQIKGHAARPARKNETREYKFPLLTKMRKMEMALANRLPTRWRSRLGKVKQNFFMRPYKVSLDPSDRQHMFKLFRPEIKELEQLTRLDLSQWAP